MIARGSDDWLKLAKGFYSSGILCTKLQCFIIELEQLQEMVTCSIKQASCISPNPPKKGTFMSKIEIERSDWLAHFSKIKGLSGDDCICKGEICFIHVCTIMLLLIWTVLS